MARTKRSQSKHDKKVKEIANDSAQKGFDVKADIKGFSRPVTIGGFRPDVVATKGKLKTIIEVETPDSIDSARDTMQKSAFSKASSKSKNTSFKRFIAE